jgi:hypothetical protein
MDDGHELIRSVVQASSDDFPQGNPEVVNLRAAVIINGGDGDPAANLRFHDAGKLAFFAHRAVGYHDQSITFFSHTNYPANDPSREDIEGIVDWPYRLGDADPMRDPVIARVAIDTLTDLMSSQLVDRDIFSFNFVDHGANKHGPRTFYPADNYFEATVGSYLQIMDASGIDYDSLGPDNQAIHGYRKIYTLSPCRSGGMISSVIAHCTPPSCVGTPDAWDWDFSSYGAAALGGADTVVLTSVRWNEDNNWPWMETVIESLFGGGDANGDSLCSIEEAFYRGWESLPPAEKDNQHPQLDDDADGQSHSPDEISYQPDAIGSEGYIARRTFL